VKRITPMSPISLEQMSDKALRELIRDARAELARRHPPKIKPAVDIGVGDRADMAAGGEPPDV
jgi:hypothetical protein